ncbi:sugar phosphate isomerase/epimerase family protein [Planctomycetaceae bacterium SH139]
MSSANLTRRQLLLQSLGGAACGLSLASLLPITPAKAIDPIPRTGRGPLKLSLAAYSFRQRLSLQPDKPGAMDLFELVNFCRQHQVPGIELTSYYFPSEFDQSYLRRLARHCHLQGITISGGAIRNDFCVAPAELDQQLDHVKKWVDAYAILGAPVIRIFAGSPPAGVSREEAINRCVAACETACQYAGQKGVMLALENHHGITDTADSMLQVVQQVDSPWFGVNFDSGNFKSTDSPYDELARIAPYAVNAQIKVEMWQAGNKVDADLPRIVDILRQANYGGWVVFEYEAAEPAEQAVPKHLAELAQLLG